ncbi:hypothetical protein BDF21DRAFT_234586 [Thamnidium elegans]|nr:hypothetical protein BDF21DRAFT_234586 [Thamnidium elegans]
MSQHGSNTSFPEESQTNSPEQESSSNSLNDNQKLIEAKTAVILLKNSRLSTKNEYTQWLLKMLYQPCARKDEDGKNVLYLSRSRRKIWASDFFIHQDPSRIDIVNRHKDQLYVITPKTTILTLAQDNRLVYIIDLSSSLATVGNTRSDILLSEVFDTLKNSLEGLVQPFSMQVSPTEKVVVQPSLRLTVMADCSQFASNVNVIPMLVEHPTMRVFTQNVIINTNNIHIIIRKLRSEFLAFQNDTTQFRKSMKRNRPNMGYDLDVGNEVAPPGGVGVLDATSFLQHVKPKSYSADSTPLMSDNTSNRLHTSSSDANIAQKGKETSYHSSKKEVWGIGKSGANLSRILHAGHFALKLLPKQGRAQLILITDGAMKSNVHDNTFVRQFAEEDITCHIIQIGYASSFVPGRNFGFVPDTEILQFLARATSGTFMYSEKCLTKIHTNHAEDANRAPKSYPTVQFVDLNKATHISTPNIYHRQFLFRETVLTRYHHSEFILQAEKDSGIPHRRDNLEANNELRDRFNFPWDPYAKPPEGDWRLLKYREYTLPSEFSHIIAARAREGFTVQSVTFDDGTGSRHYDSGINNLEALDFSAVRKERIQIVMMMRWQPNISIEYRIRATWLPAVIGSCNYKDQDLLMSSSIFSRGKAPRAEIFVRTDAGFAHMLQNWDVFRRRAQMMGVVTGSIYFGETYTAPMYSKIEKLKTYLVDIYEGDEVLKTVIGFPSKFWMSASNNNNNDQASNLRSETLNSRPGSTQQKTHFIDSFKDYWERMNHSEARARTRSWYDPGCIDLLIGDISPYMTPKLTSTSNQDFVFNVEEDILYMVANVKQVMREWSDFEAKDGTFVKMLHRIMTSPATMDEQNKDYFTASLIYPPSFCELRVRHEYGRLITLRLLFFNVDVLVRNRTTENLVHLLKTTDGTKAPCNMICERPFSRLLMRDPKHFADAVIEPNPETPGGERALGSLTKNQSRTKAWYLPVAMWLTSEYIVRDYLRHMTWSWQTDNHQDFYHKENKMMPIHDLAFQFLCQVRLDQGYQLVSPRPDSTHFYQEISLPNRDGKTTSLCAIQYFVWKDSVTGKITTELWMEPSGSFDYDQYDLVKRWTFEPDRKTISQLVTFDQIHAVGRSKGVGDFKDKKKGSQQTPKLPDEDTAVMMLPQLFDVASVLRSNKFVVASFKSPQYKMTSLPPIKLKTFTPTPVYNNDSSSFQDHSSDQSGNSTPVSKNKGFSSKSHRYLRRHAATSNIETSVIDSPIPIETHRLFSFRPDALLNKNKEVIANLDVILQNYALLHYFVERSLDYISNGEILMSHHDVGAAFWQDLKGALQSVAKEGEISSTGLIPDLRKTRCFVKIFDPRSFVVILFPSLESVSTGLLKLQEENESNSISTIQKCKSLDVFMFECVRQKPMKPTKNDMPFGNPLEEDNRRRIENIIEGHEKISIKPIKYLIHESDGLGVMLRPELFEGEYSTCQSQAQLTERVLRVAQDIARDYSNSFLKSFYTCLMKGFMVDDDDLNKVLEVCNESTMNIEITEFVYAMTMQRQEPINPIQDSEIQGKFDSIFQQYFEPVQTKKNVGSNLFYYKPPFNRSDSINSRQDNLSFDDKISYIVNLVAHSQAPLLIRLYAVYKTCLTTNSETTTCSEIVAPITSIPTSFSGKMSNGEEFDLEQKDLVIDEKFPLKTGNTKVYLQIVCLNMSRSALDDYVIDDNILSSTAESLVQSMKSQPECFYSLSQDQQIALAETDSRVNWLLKEETIHSLLKFPIITLSTLKYVEKKLCAPTPYVDYETSITIPFRFVKNYAESRMVFINELEKDRCCRRNEKYRLKRIGDYFYVCEDYIYNMGEESSYSNSASPIVTDNSPVSESLIDTNSNDDFCDGLGISISQFAEREEEEEEDEEDKSPGTPMNKRPLYWLILIPHERYIQIYFYSKMQMLNAGSDILDPVKEKIKVVQERTNRLILLNYLQETRICR